MGFFDRKNQGVMDDMFDFNKDGKINPVEQMMQFEMINQMMKEEKNKDEDKKNRW